MNYGTYQESYQLEGRAMATRRNLFEFNDASVQSSSASCALDMQNEKAEQSVETFPNLNYPQCKGQQGVNEEGTTQYVYGTPLQDHASHSVGRGRLCKEITPEGLSKPQRDSEYLSEPLEQHLSDGDDDSMDTHSLRDTQMHREIVEEASPAAFLHKSFHDESDGRHPQKRREILLHDTDLFGGEELSRKMDSTIPDDDDMMRKFAKEALMSPLEFLRLGVQGEREETTAPRKRYKPSVKSMYPHSVSIVQSERVARPCEACPETGIARSSPLPGLLVQNKLEEQHFGQLTRPGYHDYKGQRHASLWTYFRDLHEERGRALSGGRPLSQMAMSVQASCSQLQTRKLHGPFLHSSPLPPKVPCPSDRTRVTPKATAAVTPQQRKPMQVVDLCLAADQAPLLPAESFTSGINNLNGNYHPEPIQKVVRFYL